MKSLITNARIRLTLYYTLVIVAISIAISLIFYVQTRRVIAAEYQRIERRIQMDMNGFIPPSGRMMVRFQPDDLLRAEQQLVWQLLKINSIVAMVVALAAYFLAGKTLQPIQQAMDEQRRFIGDAAHELKTPLTAMKSNVEVGLLDTTIPKKYKKILSENLADIHGLELLTQSLLKLARVNDQKIVLVPVLLSDVIKQGVKAVKPIALNKEILIKVDEFDPRLTVKGDQVALVDLVTIYLDNAIKYSLKTTTIHIGVRKGDQYVELYVQDEGVGIAKKDLARIFDRFYRGDSSRTKSETNGYGLGLAIAQKITKHHGATVKVTSNVGTGTQFSTFFQYS